MMLYGELAPRCYRLLDPLEDHAEEAACYEAVLLRGCSHAPDTLLELGAGAGHNAFFLKRRFRCTLTDLSPEMLALSREINPECEHVLADMRCFDGGATFDVVFVHDAVMYITTEEDLRRVAGTAFVHTRPGGAALFAPDCTRESFREHTELMSTDAGDRSLRGIAWTWDPDPGDQTFVTEYAFLIREGGRTTMHHDRHVEGVFARSTWLRILSSAGFEVETTACLLGEGSYEVFLCRRRETETG
jgi:SAM-dependent methyltransferase